MKRDSIEAFLSTWGETLFLQPSTPSSVSSLPASLNSTSRSTWTIEAELLRADTGIRIARSALDAFGNGLSGSAAKRKLRKNLGEHPWVLRAMDGCDAGRVTDPAIRLASSWRQDGRMRLQLQSLLLSYGATVEAVAAALTLDPDVVACYAELFFNVIDRRDEPIYITAISISPDSNCTAARRHEVAWSAELPGAAVHLPMSVTLGRLGLGSIHEDKSGNPEIARLTRALCMACLEPATVPLRSSALRPVFELHRKNLDYRNSDNSSSCVSIAESLKLLQSQSENSPDPEGESPQEESNIEETAIEPADTPREVTEEEPRFPVIDLSALCSSGMETPYDEKPVWTPFEFVGGQGAARRDKDDYGWFAEAGVDRLWRLLVLAGENTELRSGIADKLPPWLFEAADFAIRGNGDRGNGDRNPWAGVVRRAVELHDCPVARHLIQASLICRETSVEGAAAFLRLPTAVVEAYAILFFDLGGPGDRPWLQANVIGQLEKGLDPSGSGAILPGMSRLMYAAPRLTLERLEDLSGCAGWMLNQMGSRVVANRLATQLYELSLVHMPPGKRLPKGCMGTSDWEDAFRLLAGMLTDDSRFFVDSLVGAMQLLFESDQWKMASEENSAIRLFMAREAAGVVPESETRPSLDPGFKPDKIYVHHSNDP